VEEINKELWPPDGDRPREWHYMRMFDTVTVTYNAILEPGEDLTEYPETHRMDYAEWSERHAEYGLTIDGTPL
jgi:hypothetical protein